jgi:Tfp pilus assembly protein PilV
MARKRKPATLPADSGFALIEVVISALLIVMAGGAVLALISATTRSAAQQRARTQAYALGQEDQGRLRAMRISSLNGFGEVRTVTLNGTEFQVESSAAFVNNSSGTPSCEENNSSPDYVRITSTVKQKSGKGSPITLQSIVSPSSGSLDPSHGSLVVAATTGQGTGLSNLLLTGSGPSGFSGKTDATGCAIFADLPAGTYTLTPSGFGLVNVNGETPSGQQVQVNGNQTQRVQLQLDQPGGLRTPFVYKLGSITYQTVPAYVAIYNAGIGATAKGYKPTTETVGSTKYAVLSSLFPFKSEYTLYAGPCEGDKPPVGSEAMTTAAVVAGKTQTTTQIRMPALELTVTNGTTTSPGAAVQGARVTITDDDCSSTGKYVYTTESNGHQSETTTGPMTPALPWSTYDICASASISGTSYRLFANNVPVETLASTVTRALPLRGTGSESGKTCP